MQAAWCFACPRNALISRFFLRCYKASIFLGQTYFVRGGSRLVLAASDQVGRWLWALFLPAKYQLQLFCIYKCFAEQAKMIVLDCS